MASGDSLESKQISSTYKDLLQVPNSNSGVDGTTRTIMDGEGTESALQVSTTAVKADGTFEATGATTIGGALTLGATALTSTATELNLLDGITAIDTDITSVSASDDTLASAKSIKTYVDAQILTKDNLDEIAEGTTNLHFTATDNTKLDGIESSATADQTDAEIRTAVEAATDSNVFTDADHTKLDAIEASADVTDATNVTAAGALMDSELTDLAGVKGVTISTLQSKPSEGAFADGDKTKLDGVAASANNYAISSDLLDEDNMATNSATKVPSQQSVKAYVDSQTHEAGDITEIVAGTGLSGTSLTGPIPTLNVDAAQTQITSVGTLTSLAVTGGITSGGASVPTLTNDVNNYVVTATGSGLNGESNLTYDGSLLLSNSGSIKAVETNAVAASSNKAVWGNCTGSAAQTNHGGYLSASGGSVANYGVLGAASGSGSHNVGGYFSAADGTVNLAIQTSKGDVSFANNSGTQKLLWDAANERLGIGAVPSDALHLYSTGAVYEKIETGSSGQTAGLLLKNPANQWSINCSNTDGDFFISDDAGVERMGIDTAGDITFNNDSGVAKMTWDASAAALGIGVSVPATNCGLHVYESRAASDVSLKVENAGTSGNAILQLENDAENWQLQCAGTASDTFILRAETAGTNTLQVHTDGTLDLLQSKLKIAGSSGTDGQVLTTGGDGTIAWEDVAGGGGGGSLDNVSEDSSPQLGGDLDVNGNKIVTTSNGDIVLEPNGTGGVGIGTDAPEAKLSVAGDTSTFVSTQIRQDGAGDASLWFSLSDSTLFSMGVDNDDADSFKISSGHLLGTNDRLTIDSSGNCGISTAAPSEKLHVAGNSLLADGKLLVTNTGGNTGAIYNGAAATGDIRISGGSSSTDGAGIVLYGGSHSATPDVTLFQTGSTERMRIDSSGNVLIASASSGASSGSGGLYFYGTNSGSASIDQAQIKSVTHAANSNGGDLVFEVSNTSAVLTERMRIGSSGQVSQPVYANGAGEAITIDFDKSNLQTITLDGSEMELVLDATNHGAGKTVKVMIDYSSPMLSEIDVSSTSWSNHGSDPTSLNGYGYMILNLTSWTGSDSGVTAEWQDQIS